MTAEDVGAETSLENKLEKLFESLDYMLKASSQNARKNARVVEWFETHFRTDGRASVVSEPKQAYNRPIEQFKSSPSAVIFVCADEATATPLVRTALRKWYPELDCMLVLISNTPGQYKAHSLYIHTENELSQFFKSQLSPASVESVGETEANSATSNYPILAETEIGALSWDDARAALPSLVGVEASYSAALDALESGKHLILLGPPGTGKTQLAQHLCDSLGVHWDLTTATADWTTFETIGGYFPTLIESDGTYAASMDFSPGVVTRAIEASRWLIIDEVNRADVDKALGELFTILSGAGVKLGFQKQDEGALKNVRMVHEGHAIDTSSFNIVVPSSWRLIGTMNTSDKASLYQLSYAFMRRFAFVEVAPPPEAEYKALLERHVSAVMANSTPSTCSDWVLDVVVQIFAGTDAGSLACAGAPLGPSIALDCISMTATSLRRPGPEASVKDARSALIQAFEALMFPQFEARDGHHTAIVAALVAALELDDAQAEMLNRRVAGWTGVSFPNA